MRILHGPVNVGNQPWELSRAERRLGHKSDVAVNYGTWLGYPADKTLSAYADKGWETRLRRGLFGLSAPLRYDVLHYYFGRTFMFWDDLGAKLGDRDDVVLADLHLARRLGRRTFMTLQGCDIRLAAESNRENAITACADGRCSAYATCVSELDRDRKRMRDEILPLMDRVFYLNPELGRYSGEATFLPYANVNVSDVMPVLSDRTRKPRIVHAPSNGAIKGTPMIVAAIERLQLRYDFEFILVQNLPHAEAMAIYRSADMAIDQIYTGWYGGFAVELMAMGIPVAAYIRDEDKTYVPADMWNEMPILRINAGTLEDDLAGILDDRKHWPEMGKRARQFALDWHDPLKIARGLSRVYRDPKARLVLSP